MKFIFKRLPYKIGDQVTYDYVIVTLRLLLLLFAGASSCIALFSLFTLIFGYTISDSSYTVLFWLLLAFATILLYLGVWHTRVTSRQVYEPFKRPDKVKRIKRVEFMKRGLIISFGGAITAQITLIILTISNYILKSLSTSYQSADLFSSHTETFLGYKNQQDLLASPVPFLSAELYNAILVIMPIFILIILYVNSYIFDIRKYQTLVEQWISSRFYKDDCIEHLVFDLESDGAFSLTIGISSETQSPVVMPQSTLTLNTAFFGLIGTGKSSSLAKPIVISMSQNFVVYLRSFGRYVKRVKRKVKRLPLTQEQKKLREKELIEEWFTKGIGKDLTSGFYLNEPTGDLVKDSRFILKKTGIPKKAIWDIDPLNTYSDAINIFDADIEMAAALASDLFRDFSEGNNSSGNSFFLNSEEAHTKSLVTLLIASSKIPDLEINKHLNGGSPTFSEFYQLLTDENFIFARVSILNIIYKKEFRDYTQWKEQYEIKYQAAYDKWIAQGKHKELFTGNLSKELWKEKRELEDKYSEISNLRSAIDYFTKSYRVDPKTSTGYFNFEVNIQGLKSVIRRLAMDKRVRRIFFSQSTKNIDVLLKYGGILLVHSAAAELGKNNSKMVAQVVEIIMQSSAFRRIPNMYSLFPFIEDEKNSFLMPRDSGFLDQNRKVRTPVIHLYQNYEQAVATLDNKTADALFQSYRNAFVFQQQSNATVEYLNNRAGKKWVLSSSYRGSQGRFFAANDDNKEQLTETIEEVDQITQTEVRKLEEMEFLGIMVIDNEVSEPMKVTSTPSFKMPLFTDKNYQADFDISNKKDKELYDLWQECVDEAYVDSIQRTVYYEHDFTPEEWKNLLGIENPINMEVDLFNFEEKNDSEQRKSSNERKSEERYNSAKNNVSSQKSLLTESNITEDLDQDSGIDIEKKEPNIMTPEPEAEKENLIEDVSDTKGLNIPPEEPNIIAQNLQTSPGKEELF